MKLVRVASTRHLRNWEAPDALVQEITPSGELNDPWAKLRRGHTEDTGKRPAVFYTYLPVNFLSQNKAIGSPLRWKASTFA